MSANWCFLIFGIVALTVGVWGRQMLETLARWITAVLDASDEQEQRKQDFERWEASQW